MCEGFEWYTLQSEAEQRAKKEKADELKKQGNTAAPAKSPAPKKQQEDPVPA